MSITDQFVDFITAAPVENEAAYHITSLSLLDWAAVTIAGMDEPIANIIRSLVEEECGTQQAYAAGLSQHVPARAAALVNGTTSHALDYDDTHFSYIGHPSVVVFPAVFAFADKIGSDMVSIKEAALIGLETTTRIGVWLGRTHYRTGFHITATAGAIGATAGCSKLLGFSAEQTRTALSLVASMASGVKEQFGTMGKPFHAGMAASSAVEACLLAEKGIVSGFDALTGVQGFGATHHSEENSFACDGLGKDWLFTDVSHKFHACCHGTHAMLEALALIKNAHSFALEEVEYIEVFTHPQYRNVCDIKSPATGTEAKFSYRLIAAMGLSGIETARPDCFSDDLCNIPNLIRLRDLTNVITDDLLSDTQTKVTVNLSNSRKLRSEYDLLDLRAPHEREARVRAKAASLLGRAREEHLWQIIGNVSLAKPSRSFCASLLGVCCQGFSDW
ncbi:MmgE/PrpD family protein [Rhodobacteraceae bacterium Araon29]